MELRLMAERIAARERRTLVPVVETSSVAMVRALACGGSRVGFLVQENVAQDLAEARLVWLPLADAQAHSQICLYQRIGQTSAVATGVLVEHLDRALQTLPQPPAGPRRKAA